MQNASQSEGRRQSSLSPVRELLYHAERPRFSRVPLPSYTSQTSLDKPRPIDKMFNVRPQPSMRRLVHVFSFFTPQSSKTSTHHPSSINFNVRSDRQLEPHTSIRIAALCPQYPALPCVPPAATPVAFSASDLECMHSGSSSPASASVQTPHRLVSFKELLAELVRNFEILMEGGDGKLLDD